MCFSQGSYVTRNFQKKLFALFFGGISCVLTLLIFIFVIGSNVETQQQDIAQKMITRLEGAVDDARTVLDALHNEKLMECNKDALFTMRQWLLRSRYIKHISIVDGKTLTCTTSYDDRPIPSTLTEHTITTNEGISIWVNYPIELSIWPGRITHITVYRKYNYSLYSIAADFTEYLKPGYSLAITWGLPSAPDAIHLRGEEGLWHKHQSLSPLLQAFSPSTQACSTDNRNLCIFFSLSAAKFFKQYGELWLFGIILSPLLGALVYFFTSQMWDRYFSMERRLLRGIRHGHFYWLYQPIVELETGSVIGCEALVRFQDGSGPLYPDQFLPVLKAANLTWPFTELMFEYILSEFNNDAQFPDDFKISCNIFPRDIENANIQRLISNKQLVSSRFQFTLEIIEDEYLEHTRVQEALRELRKTGFDLAIDDFGTGYSNLKELSNNTFDFLKIDRAFVKDIESDGVKTSIVPLIADIAVTHGMQVIAEGIEETHQAQELLKFGIRYGQGWLFGRPEPFSKLLQRVAK